MSSLDGQDESLPPSTIRNYHGIEYDINDPKYAGLSKNALKRLLKDEHYQRTKDQRINKLREKERQKKEKRRQRINEGLSEPPPKRIRNQDVPIGNRRVIIDCAFSDYMVDKEIDSIACQLIRCYSCNRSAKEAMKLYVTSLDGKLKEKLDIKVSSRDKWKHIDIVEKPYDELFDKASLVYLSADSDHVANEIEEDKVYIIGGIVDKNRYKNLCQNKATSQGIQTARLPIGEYIQMASRKVLTVNQVYEIMLKWVEYRDWEKAFMEVIPERKLKGSTSIQPSSQEATDTTATNQQIPEASPTNAVEDTSSQ